MSDDLVKRLWRGGLRGDDPIAYEAAERIEELEKQLAASIKQIKELENELENMEYEMENLNER